jgi:hypothetical protein
LLLRFFQSIISSTKVLISHPSEMKQTMDILTWRSSPLFLSNQSIAWLA